MGYRVCVAQAAPLVFTRLSTKHKDTALATRSGFFSNRLYTAMSSISHKLKNFVASQQTVKVSKRRGSGLSALEGPFFIALHFTTPRYLPIFGDSGAHPLESRWAGGFWLPLIQHCQPRDAPHLWVVQRCHVHV